MQPLALDIDNQIPIGKGCGSSAAARLAGIALAVHFGKLRWTDSRIVGEASRREHHPDNAAACWMGGLAVARMSARAKLKSPAVIPKGNWPLLLAVPDEALRHGRSAPRASVAIFAGRRCDQRSEFHAAAGGFCAGPPRSAGGRARRPHASALSGCSLSAIAGAAEARGGHFRHSGRGPERSWAVSVNFSG